MNNNFNQEENKEEFGTNGKRKTGAFLKLTTYAAVFGLIGGVTFQGVDYIGNHYIDKERSSIESEVSMEDSVEETTHNKEATVVNTSTAQYNSVGDVSSIAENVIPSIVAINVKANVATNDVFGREFEQESQGSGSGIIIGKNETEILIATNNHVIEGANSVEVVFVDETATAAIIKGKDSNTDLAVVSVKIADLKDETKDAIKVATVGNSDTVKVGEQAIAIGNALGYGTSVTVGYISAKDREVSIEDSSMTLLQTDAAINPGNSGGALVNAAGEVIGINSVKYASEEVEGMGFSIPISKAVPIINELMNQEQVPVEEQAYLGISGQDVTTEYAERFSIPIGIYVEGVSENSPAATAGMLEGQIITKYNEKSLTTMEELQDVLSKAKAGDTATITVQELIKGEYKEKEIQVALGNKPTQ